MDEELEEEIQETTPETPIEEAISLKSEIIAELGANYNTSDSAVLDTILADVTSIATQVTNLKSIDERLKPYIKKATKSEYLCRGADGLSSRGEGSISASYKDITDTLRADLIRGGLRRCY